MVLSRMCLCWFAPLHLCSPIAMSQPRSSSPSPAAAPAVETAPEVSAEPSPKKAKKGDLLEHSQDFFGEPGDQWVAAQGSFLSLDSLAVGVGVEMGQVRALDPNLVQQRVRDLKQAPPDKPIAVTVWNPSLADTSVPPSSSPCASDSGC